MSWTPVIICVSDPSHVGEGRRAGAIASEAADLDKTASGKVAIIATELGNNLRRYAHRGELHISTVMTATGPGVEIVSVDSGPGMPNVPACMEDGYSTGGTPGNGLGAVKRLSDEFDVFSVPEKGTVILSRVLASAVTQPTRASRKLSWGAASRPAPGEIMNGDAWRVISREESFAIMMADGLGHGPQAAEAARAAMEGFEGDPFAGPSRVLENSHATMSGTRGAAAAAAELNFNTMLLRYAGVGNISGTLFAGIQSSGLFTHNGTLGVKFRKSAHFEYTWPPDGLLVMHSDGVQTRWELSSYPGLVLRHPGVIAAILLRDFCRGRDDATVVAVRLDKT